MLLTQNLMTLQRRGLVTREECTDDGRGAYVTVSVEVSMADRHTVKINRDQVIAYRAHVQALTTAERAAIRVQAAILAQLVEVPQAHVRYDEHEPV